MGSCRAVGTAGVVAGTRGAPAVAQPGRADRRGGTAESVPVLSGGPSGAYRIDGLGAGFVVPLWQDGLADRIELVSTDEAVAMALRLAREEGVFAGTSSGANLVAALQLAEQLGRGATIVTVACDTGMKYLTNGSVPQRAEVGCGPRWSPLRPARAHQRIRSSAESDCRTCRSRATRRCSARRARCRCRRRCRS